MLMTQCVALLLLLVGEGEAAGGAGIQKAGVGGDYSWLAMAGIVASIAISVVTGTGALLLSLLTGGKRLVDRVDELNTKVFSLTNQILTLQQDLGQCRLEHAESKTREAGYKADLEKAQLRLTILENATGASSALAQSLPGIVVVDYQGKIVEFSPALTAITGWLPNEMYGKSVEVLVPPELLQKHQQGFKAAIEPSAVLDPTKRINTFLLDKAGNRVPVAIAVRKLLPPTSLMTATISARSLVPGNSIHIHPMRRLSDHVS